MEELMVRARKDFINSGMDECHWGVYWRGYVDAVKRFGGK